ncbi:MAG: CTP synthase [Bdellovibrionales bacterium RIFOXYD12_FULL_39_22]|nr:MAG: CTP synthase [Bdellovibrionales bacterium RIFOXYB1_FULL_39_21]OFZ43185.1 MAG: CTP synthase [Bdellovibrionales bacterium RIFOXYC12_FULL_39_17]OFZ47923.1 MAG: CTP synthase [Bdellovibrionales bacterium RIFOXYC1_FULL_39_130]OFZ75703.1 MAG: CTP synthase [Bdellovibrionales bacterium RIFOXYD1_FULL_39_84]OFZ94193.1 MAG: CTP synthase [Bdellovibrionales bacterium RIFOXYD12_FULL_39_22]HLE11740.1 CTP synthase [Bacteriovoracaceae bacterium]
MSKKNNKKFIFITGGVASSLGKGLAAASIAALLERRGIKINLLKMDPYINVDPGTMSPIQHGEVFVTDDGAETDLDLGHYERFTSLTLSRDSNFTTGKVYLRVIENEREGKYLGKTVQVVPHITDEIKRRIHLAAENADLLIGEIGGTVGDIESLPFLEAIRQLSTDVGSGNVLFIHLVLLPYIAVAGEVKTKPAQHSVKELRSLGLFPQMIICRSDRDLDASVLEKLSLFCNVPKDHVFHSIDVDSIYKVPLSFHKQGLDEKIAELLGIWTGRPNISDLEQVIFNVENPVATVRIGIVGKYTDLIESYKSLDEALKHGAIANRVKLDLIYIDAEKIEELSEDAINKVFANVNGILIPGGFGKRGVEGKIRAIEHARTHKVPFFGICLGLQLAIVEFARNVVGIKDATSEEFESPGTFVIHYMAGQSRDGSKGGSMRLGAYECSLANNSLACEIYHDLKISERHRHRLEVNNDYIEKLQSAGMVISGKNDKLGLVEVIELKEHPYFIACQYHPEFKSRPYSPHPLFRTFISAAYAMASRKKA